MRRMLTLAPGPRCHGSVFFHSNGCPRCLALGNGRPRTQNRPRQTTTGPGKRVSSDRSIAGEKPTNSELTGHAHRTLEYENRSLGNYCLDRDDLFIASNAASAYSGRAWTTKSSVRFTERTFPDGSIRNSAGREMSAPSRRP
jgi:hypothetical protein